MNDLAINEGNKIISDHCLQIPLCTCGKCVIKRSKKDHFHSLPYSKNLSSLYQNDFGWKNPRVFKTDYLKATHYNATVRRNLDDKDHPDNPRLNWTVQFNGKNPYGLDRYVKYYGYSQSMRKI